MHRRRERRCAAVLSDERTATQARDNDRPGARLRDRFVHASASGRFVLGPDPVQHARKSNHAVIRASTTRGSPRAAQTRTATTEAEYGIYAELGGQRYTLAEQAADGAAARITAANLVATRAFLQYAVRHPARQGAEVISHGARAAPSISRACTRLDVPRPSLSITDDYFIAPEPDPEEERVRKDGYDPQNGIAIIPVQGTLPRARSAACGLTCGITRLTRHRKASRSTHSIRRRSARHVRLVRHRQSPSGEVLRVTSTRFRTRFQWHPRGSLSPRAVRYR